RAQHAPVIGPAAAAGREHRTALDRRLDVTRHQNASHVLSSSKRRTASNMTAAPFAKASGSAHSSGAWLLPSLHGTNTTAFAALAGTEEHGAWGDAGDEGGGVPGARRQRQRRESEPFRGLPQQRAQSGIASGRRGVRKNVVAAALDPGRSSNGCAFAVELGD